MLTMGHYTIPNVIERTHTGERATDVFSRLLSERIVFLGSEIDDDVANVVMAQFLHLEAREVARVRAQMLDVLSQHTGRSVEALRADTDREHVFDAAEAQAYGLIDGIITHRSDVRAPSLTRP